MKLPLQHYLGLIGIIAIGTALRFWHLDFKPLWMDEVITALFSLGRNYQDVPLEKAFPLSAVEQIFSLKPEATCSQIAQVVSAQSVHPPLFFCLMHHWLSWVNPTTSNLVWQLRALPALIGVGTIMALYCLNRLAFSPAAGLMGAAVMAVSPFGVYLSQEARHYTLPMLLITLSLLGLIQIQQDLYQRQHFRPVILLSWIGINSLGFYVHYFFLLAFIAQVVPLIGFLYRRRRSLPRHSWGVLGLAITGVSLSYLPWLPTFISHLSRPETDWLGRSTTTWADSLTPLAQTLAGWIVMVITFPVESQPPWITIPAALLMILFTGWLVWHISRGLRQLGHSPGTHLAMLTLASFTLCVLLEFFAIVYILGKDITVAPRYNFTYYPGICALLGASLVNLPYQLKSDYAFSNIKMLSRPPLLPFQDLQRFFSRPPVCCPQRKYPISPRQIQTSILLVSILSCLFVNSDLAFQKPFYPQQVAKDINLEPTRPRMVVVGYDTLQDVALGLSFALAARDDYPDPKNRSSAYFAFFKQEPSIITARNALGHTNQNASETVTESPVHEQFWQNLSRVEQPLEYPLNLWVIVPNLKQKNYLPTLLLSSQSSSDNQVQAVCTLTPPQHPRLGVSYQLYRCAPTVNP